jgi:CRP/FNR family transcriptional regulator, cyclic AMP receptor protein
MTSPFDALEFYAQLDADQRKLFERIAHPIAVAKHDVIINQDVQSTDVFFVVDGQFEVAIYSEKGKSVFYRTVMPGDLFGDLAAIDDKPRSATVTAQTDGRLIRIGGPDFKKFVESSMLVAMWVVHKHIALIRALTGRLFEQVAFDVVTRIRAELVRLAVTAGVVNNQARIAPMPAHHVIANKLGTTREAVTRELNDLARKGLIKQQSRELLILDFDGLKRLVTPPAPTT